MKTKLQNTVLNILLADDDKDDRIFFKMALKEISIATHLTTVGDGEKLMDYLLKNSEHLPDVLFLDLNMPRMNGAECLSKIKSNKKLKLLPVIIYSTSFDDAIVDILYKKGAHYYIRKRYLSELAVILEHILKNEDGKLVRPAREEFVLNHIAI